MSRTSDTIAQMLLDSAVDYAIYLLDLDGTVMSWNSGAQRIKGYTAQEIIGSNFSIFFTDGDARAGEPARALEIARLTGKFESEGWRVRKDGTRLWASVVIDVVRNSSGELIGFAKITRDVTERVAQRAAVTELSEQLLAERQQLIAAKLGAEEANAAKTDFLASMSHEIRTPMNGIIGLTSLLLDDAPTVEQLHHLNLLADSGRSLLAIINDILDWSKVESGRIDLESIALSPAGLVDGALSIVRGEALAKGIALDFHVAPDVPAWVSGDPTRLRQVLLNLLTNALKFTEHGRVSLTVRCEPGTNAGLLRFEISDTGIGIAPERQHLLFQSFSQVDRSNARKYGGTGLGLAISRHLAKAMSGTIGMTSTIGIGSAFWFTAQLPATVAASAAPAASGTISAARRILVVDDNAINQVVAKGMLVRDGHDVVLVDNGAEALAAVRASSFDLVLMDMQMPVMDGMEATRRIRSLEGPVRNIPIVALTANAMAAEITRCREAGMNDHLAKPIDRELLRQSIAAWTTITADRGPQAATHAPMLERAKDEPNPVGDGLTELDIDRLLELFENDYATVAAILDEAIESIKTDAQRVGAGVTTDDAEIVIQAAHHIKGTCGDVGANRLREIASLVERLAKQESWAIAPSLLAELQVAVDALSVKIEAFTKETAPR